MCTNVMCFKLHEKCRYDCNQRRYSNCINKQQIDTHLSVKLKYCSNESLPLFQTLLQQPHVKLYVREQV